MPRPARRFCAAALLASCMVLGPRVPVALADTLTTTRGTIYEGDVTRDEKGNYVITRESGGTLTFPKELVSKVVSKKPLPPAGNTSNKSATATASPTVAPEASTSSDMSDPATLRKQLENARQREERIEADLVKVEQELESAESNAAHYKDVAKNGVPFAGGRMINLNEKGRHVNAAKRATGKAKNIAARRRELLARMSAAVRDAVDSGQKLAARDPSFTFKLNTRELNFSNRLVDEGSAAYFGRDEVDGKPDFTRAFSLFTEASALGSPDGAFNIGIMYLQGDGRKADRAQAAEWFRKSADRGHLQGMKNIADMLIDGDPIARNPAVAVQLYQRASEGGNIGAMVALAKVLATGNGVAQDVEGSSALFQHAAAITVSLVANDLQAAMANAVEEEKTDSAQAYRNLKAAARSLLGDFDTLMNPIKLAELERSHVRSMRFCVESLSLSAELAAESEILRRKAALGSDVQTEVFASNQIKSATANCVERLKELLDGSQKLMQRWPLPQIKAAISAEAVTRQSASLPAETAQLPTSGIPAASVPNSGIPGAGDRSRKTATAPTSTAPKNQNSTASKRFATGSTPEKSESQTAATSSRAQVDSKREVARQNVLALPITSVTRCMAFSPNGALLASGGEDRIVHVWNLLDGKEVGKFIGSTGAINAVAFSADGAYVAAGGDDKSVRMWNTATGRQMWQSDSLAGWEVQDVSFAPDGKHLLSTVGGLDRATYVWRAETGKLVRKFEAQTGQVAAGKGARRRAAFLDDERILSTTRDRNIRLWRLGDGSELAREAQGEDCFKITVAPQGEHFLTAAVDGEVRLRDASELKLLQSFKGHSDEVYALAVSIDGRWAASGGKDRSVMLWDLSRGTAARRFQGHSNPVLCLYFDSDGKTLMSAGGDHTVRRWTLPASADAETDAAAPIR